MSGLSTTERLMTEVDHVRLKKLATLTQHADLQDLLSGIDLCPSREIDAKVVTMASQVEIEDLRTGRIQTLAVSYPQEADAARGRISVLSPVGLALIGLRVGDVAEWDTPAGEPVRARIRAVVFQPEASGDYLR